MNFGGLNLGDMMKQVQKMQEEMSHIQDTLRHKTIAAESGAGMVQVVVNGAQELVSIKIDPQLIKPDDAQMLQDLVVAAVNKGLQESRSLAEGEMQRVSSFLPKIPGLNA